MSATFFAGAHNFTIGSMTTTNIDGDYYDNRQTNVRNTFRHGDVFNNYYNRDVHNTSNTYNAPYSTLMVLLFVSLCVDVVDR